MHLAVISVLMLHIILYYLLHFVFSQLCSLICCISMVYVRIYFLYFVKPPDNVCKVVNTWAFIRKHWWQCRVVPFVDSVAITCPGVWNTDLLPSKKEMTNSNAIEFQPHHKLIIWQIKRRLMATSKWPRALPLPVSFLPPLHQLVVSGSSHDPRSQRTRNVGCERGSEWTC